MNANSMAFYSSAITTPLINMAGGTLVLLGDQSAIISTDVTAGFIKAYNGASTIQCSVAGGYTTVTAIPEPATILLFGLCGLIFTKRRT
jgi:ethanolamine utilization microcompartment shell protein EutS